jgi:hypothetical protein
MQLCEMILKLRLLPRAFVLLPLLGFCVFSFCLGAQTQPRYQLVIAGGRVVDPESGLDAEHRNGPQE